VLLEPKSGGARPLITNISTTEHKYICNAAIYSPFQSVSIGKQKFTHKQTRCISKYGNENTTKLQFCKRAIKTKKDGAKPTESSLIIMHSLLDMITQTRITISASTVSVPYIPAKMTQN